MTAQEKAEWDELYSYVKYKILDYDSNQSLSKTMCLRLKGLTQNKFIENKKISGTANYSFKVILNTFKYCIVDIQRGLRNNSFHDDFHKLNYVLRIVEPNINTVYAKMKEADINRKFAEKVDISRVNEYKNNFKATPDKKRKNNYDDMW